MNPRQQFLVNFAASNNSGKKYWRTLEELADSAEFQQIMRREYPAQAEVWPSELNRRKFLALMAASLALAGLEGCSVRPAPRTQIVPYVRPPRDIVAGEPLFFATAMNFCGAATGLLVESHMGRPTKIEGNPDHPNSLGATNIFHQASVLALYDPDRSQAVTHLGRTRTWDEAAQAIRSAVSKAQEKNGRGLRVLSGGITSPTLQSLRSALLNDLPDARWREFEPVNRVNNYAGTRLAFGRPLNAVYMLEEADVIVALDCDFMSLEPGSLRYIHDFCARRRVVENKQPPASLNRLYVCEPHVSITGAKADHRLPMRTAQIGDFIRALAAQLQVTDKADIELAEDHQRYCKAIAEDLRQHRGRSMVMAGLRQPAWVHALAAAINQSLDNVGRTVRYTRPIDEAATDQTDNLAKLVDEMGRGEVETLLILGTNPAYNAPADLKFADSLKQVPLRIHLGLYQDETARQCHWHLPEAHYLEAWGDARAYEGAVSLVQPLIEPLYTGRSTIEVMHLMHTSEWSPTYQIVRDFWRQQWRDSKPKDDFESLWQHAVHDGIVPDTAFEDEKVELTNDWQQAVARQTAEAQARHDVATKSSSANNGSEAVDLCFVPDPSVFDGDFANSGWLQELPKPITKLTWDNAALMSPATAQRLGVGKLEYGHGGEHGGYEVSLIELSLGDRRLTMPVWIVPGHVDGAITVELGYGRRYAGRVALNGEKAAGVDVYPLRDREHPWFVDGVGVRKVDGKFLLACTQQHHLMENRELVRSATLDEFRQDPHFAKREAKPVPDVRLYPPHPTEPPLHKWGMSIDLSTCIGCNACVIACQAENNIPVVGKTEVAAGREMHWIRVDRYFAGNGNEPNEIHFQPVPCMHCEQAPCEYVCPVEATVHSADGLNDMIYNRCVGTRFCSNNCPYKVRRFNFLAYADFNSQSTGLQLNPDVTVRSRGVMEKCTYCVQRLRHAEIVSQRENRPLIDGEVLTACQAVCPAQAIVFGDLNDKTSQVGQWKSSPLDYGLLADLNTAPRTTYVAGVRNPNPELTKI